MKKALLLIALCSFVIQAPAFDWRNGWEVKAGVNRRQSKGCSINTPSTVYQNMRGTIEIPRNTSSGVIWNEEFTVSDTILGDVTFGYNESTTPPEGTPIEIYEEDFDDGTMYFELGYIPVINTRWSCYSEISIDNTFTEKSDNQNIGCFIEASKKLCDIRDNDIFLDIGFSKNIFDGSGSAIPFTQDLYLQKIVNKKNIYYSWTYWDGDSFDQSLGTYFGDNDKANQLFELYLPDNGFPTKPKNKSVTKTSLAAVFKDSYATSVDVSLNTFSIGSTIDIPFKSKTHIRPGMGISINQIDIDGTYHERFYNETTSEVIAQLILDESKSSVKTGAYLSLGAEVDITSNLSVGVNGRYDYVPGETIQVGPSEMSFDGSGGSGKVYASYKV